MSTVRETQATCTLCERQCVLTIKQNKRMVVKVKKAKCKRGKSFGLELGASAFQPNKPPQPAPAAVQDAAAKAETAKQADPAAVRDAAAAAAQALDGVTKGGAAAPVAVSDAEKAAFARTMALFGASMEDYAAVKKRKEEEALAFKKVMALFAASLEEYKAAGKK